MRLAHPAVFASILLLAGSCAPRHPEDVRALDTLRTRAEQLIEAQSLMAFNAWAFGTPSNQDSLYRAHLDLFTPEHIALAARAEEEEPDPVQRKRFRYFRRYLTFEYLALDVASLTDSIANIEATTILDLDGTPIPYRGLSSMIVNEEDAARRERLYIAADPALDRVNDLHLRAHARTMEAVRRLGYASYDDMVAQLKGFSLDHLQGVCETFLAQTDSLSFALLDERSRAALGMERRQLRWYDMGRLFRGTLHDRFFPAAGMVEAAQASFATMGIDLAGLRSLTIDTVVRPGKNPRAACFAVRVPEDIRLSVKPSGGAADYAALFHELGHGLQYAFTRDNSFEFRYLGEPTLTETFAFLSEFLLVNQAWLRSRTAMRPDELKHFLRSEVTARLLAVRRYCAQFIYERALHAGTPEPSREYARLLTRALGIPPHPSDERRYLANVDPLYYSASYLRAWFLEAQLNAALGTQYGVNWFEDPDAGRFLLEAWARGDKLDAEEFASLAGLGHIRPDALLTELRSMLHFSSR